MVTSTLSLAFVINVALTLIVCLLWGGSIWVYEDNTWILYFEIILAFISIFLIGVRWRRDLEALAELRLYRCRWSPCGLNVDGLCSLVDPDEVRECKRVSFEGWGRRL